MGNRPSPARNERQSASEIHTTHCRRFQKGSKWGKSPSRACTSQQLRALGVMEAQLTPAQHLEETMTRDPEVKVEPIKLSGCSRSGGTGAQPGEGSLVTSITTPSQDSERVSVTSQLDKSASDSGPHTRLHNKTARNLCLYFRRDNDSVA